MKKRKSRKRQALGSNPLTAAVKAPARRTSAVELLIAPRPPRKTLEVHHPALLPHQTPRQRSLLKPTLRAATVKALATKPKGRNIGAGTRAKLREQTPENLREAICADYRRSRQQRRETLFAVGSAGTGRKNKGPRRPDWRAEYCK